MGESGDRDKKTCAYRGKKHLTLYQGEWSHSQSQLERKVAGLANHQIGVNWRYTAAYVCSGAHFRRGRGAEGGGGEGRGEMAGLAVFVRLIRQLDRGEDGEIYVGTHGQARRWKVPEG